MPTCLPARLAKLLHACLSLCCSPLSLISRCGPTHWDKLVLTLTSTAQLSLSPAAFLFTLLCHTCRCVYCFHLFCLSKFYFPCKDKPVTVSMHCWQSRCLHISLLMWYSSCAAGVSAPLHSIVSLMNSAWILMEFQGLLCFWVSLHCGYSVDSTGRELCFCW